MGVAQHGQGDTVEAARRVEPGGRLIGHALPMNEPILLRRFDRLLKKSFRRLRIASDVSDFRRNKRMLAGEILGAIMGPRPKFFLVRRQCLQDPAAICIGRLATGTGERQRVDEGKLRLHGHGHGARQRFLRLLRMHPPGGVVAHQIAGEEFHRVIEHVAGDKAGLDDLADAARLVLRFIGEGRGAQRLAHQAFAKLLLQANGLVHGIIARPFREIGVAPRKIQDSLDPVAAFDRLPDHFEGDMAREHEIPRIHASQEGFVEDGNPVAIGWSRKLMIAVMVEDGAPAGDVDRACTIRLMAISANSLAVCGSS